MNITSAQYTSMIEGTNDAIAAVIDGQRVCVPLDLNNRHYVAIQKWVAEDGGEIQAAD